MGIGKKKETPNYARPSDYSCFHAAANGNAVTKASLLVWGLGNLLNKQIARGVIFLALEIGYLIYMISFGINAVGNFFTLGTNLQQEVFDEAQGIYVYVAGDNSMLCLLYGVITALLTAVAVFVAFALIASSNLLILASSAPKSGMGCI